MPGLSSHKGSWVAGHFRCNVFDALMILGKRTGASPTRLRTAMEAGWHTSAPTGITTLPKREADGQKMGIWPRRAIFQSSTAKTQQFGHGAVGSDWLAVCRYVISLPRPKSIWDEHFKRRNNRLQPISSILLHSWFVSLRASTLAELNLILTPMSILLAILRQACLDKQSFFCLDTVSTARNFSQSSKFRHVPRAALHDRRIEPIPSPGQPDDCG